MKITIAMLFTALLCGGIGYCADEIQQNTKPIAEVKKEIDEGKAILVDCREKKEWDAGHLSVARSLALSELKNAKPPADLPKDKTIYVHCVRGMRALTTATLLSKEGLHAVPLKEGYPELTKTFDAAK